MAENLERQDNVTDENREVALGICFGSGVGILVGALFGNVLFGLSAGGVLGILIGAVLTTGKKIKK